MRPSSGPLAPCLRPLITLIALAALCAGEAAEARRRHRRAPARSSERRPPTDRSPQAPTGPTTQAPEQPAASGQETPGRGERPPHERARERGSGSGDKDKLQVFDFTGLDIAGRMRTPQLLYFLDRAHEELERASLERRSFVPAMVRSVAEEPR